MSNPIRDALLKKIKQTSIINRGAYPYTRASNVYGKNGPYEEKDTPDGGDGPIYPVDPDVTVDPSDESTDLNTVISEATEGEAIAVTEGEVATALTIDKSITLMGESAGRAQNHTQTIE